MPLQFLPVSSGDEHRGIDVPHMPIQPPFVYLFKRSVPASVTAGMPERNLILFSKVGFVFGAQAAGTQYN
jgi:hypothetical protein